MYSEDFDMDPRSPLDLSPNLYRRPESPDCYPDIRRLPNELLEYIFLYLAPDRFWTDTPYITKWFRTWDRWYLPDDDTEPDLRVADLIHISHVSTHWRKVALNCPSLWSSIFVTSLWWTEVSLARSHGSTLKIQIDMEADTIPYSNLLAAAELLLSHVDCIQELRVCLYSWDTATNQIFTRLFLAASKLQILEISLETVFSPRAVLGTDTPAPWEVVRNLGGLTTLSLPSVKPLFRQRVTEFLAVLRCMPGLVHLDLGDVFKDARDFIPSHDLQKVNLPSLSRLFIVASLSSVVAFLSCVNIPSCEQLKIDCGSDSESPDADYDRLYPILAQLYSKDRALSLPTIRSMAIITSLPNVVFVFSTSSDCDYCPVSGNMTSFSWDSNVLLELSLNLPRHLDGTTLVDNICALMPTTRVSKLQTQVTPFNHSPLAYTLWKTALGHLPALQRIIFNNIFMEDAFATSFSLFPNIGEHAEHGIGDQNELSLAPKLEEIEFVRSIFQGLVNPSDRPELGQSNFKLPPFRDLKPFFDALSSCKASRVRLVLTECKTEDDIGTVYDMVAERDGDQLFRIVKSERTYCPLFGEDRNEGFSKRA